MAKKIEVTSAVDTLHPVAQFAQLPLPPWTLAEAGGVPVEHYYRNRGVGSRCLWMAAYLTPVGVIRADDLLPLVKASRLQVKLEIEDILGAGYGDLREAIRQYFALVESDPEGGVPRRVVQWLAGVRPSYPESIAWWLPMPDNVRQKTFRRGWAPAGYAGKVV